MSSTSLRTIDFLIDGEPGALITVTETAAGELNLNVRVTDVISGPKDLPDIGDLRGLFFHVSDESLLKGLSISGSDVSAYKIGANAIMQVDGDVNMNGEVGKAVGPFDVGIAFGTPGIGKDDIRETAFTLSGSEPLNLDWVLQQHFGLRLTSVSDNGAGRNLSLKLAGQMTGTPKVLNPDPVDPGPTDPGPVDPHPTKPNPDPTNPPGSTDPTHPVSYDDLIEGGDGNDTIYGGLGNDEMQGEGGDDLIIGGKDDGRLDWTHGLSVAIGDNLYGNDGRDTYLYKKGDGVDLIWDFQPGQDVIRLTGYKLQDVAAITLVKEVANRIHTDSHDKIALILDKSGDAIIFNDFPNPSENDVAIVFADGRTLSSAQLLALAKANPIEGGSAFSSMTGANSNGSSSNGPGASPLDLYGNNDDDILIGGLGDDRLYGNEGVNGLNGRGGNDQLFGGNTRDTIIGGEGDDSAYGNGGDDIIIGNAGGDKLYGAGGDDLIFGDDAEGVDLPSLLTSYTPAAAGEEVGATIRIKRTWWGGFEGEIDITANESLGHWGIFLCSKFNLDNVWGARTVGETSWSKGVVYKLDNANWNGSLSVGQKTTIGFTAQTGVNGVVDIKTLLAGLSIVKDITTAEPTGQDVTMFLGNTLRGFGGADTLVGTADDDTFYIDDTRDKVSERASSSTHDKIVTSVSYALASNVEDMAATTGAGGISLSGNAIGNGIQGNDRANRINGGLGNDTLTGGAGKDTFVFDTKLGTYKTNKSVNLDKITDFSVKDDTIWLDNAIFKKLGKAGKLNKDFFVVGSKAQDGDDYLIYDKKTGKLFYDADGAGGGKATEFAQLSKNLKLTYADFLVI
ncbi:calcium-binding protein [Microvirga terricola]|uniref:CBM2 domain-containing protein n=1 Tax=Microvirga terricola TaxID=2719797 RepID=A0ABX0V925_9HYPH|nr:calcium-binding protein [Microvirga terricola]NIX76352.1 hypothetical protein [Microvirga terricola]